MIELQRKLLADTQRNKVFVEALRRVVRPGRSVVVDLGAGTGFLSLAARGMGAKACHLVEADPPVLALARRVTRANKVTGFHFHEGFSNDLDPAPRGDVVVSETLGNFALEERIIETMNDASRFMLPGAALLPRELRQYVAPVVTDRFNVELDPFTALRDVADFTEARRMCFHNMFVRTVKNADLLDDVRTWDRVDFRKRNGSRRSAELEWKATSAMTVHGFALWWECTVLDDDLVISTSPYAPPTHWEQVYLPLHAPVALHRGDVVELVLRSDSALDKALRVQWTATHRRGRNALATHAHDTWSGR